MFQTTRWLVLIAAAGLLLVGMMASGARQNCVPIEPQGPFCPEPNPQGCVSTGCPGGETCTMTSGRCVPSRCDCDEAAGAWVCTADCGGGICVPGAPGCQGPNPAGCLQSGCPEGWSCVQDSSVCVSSSCVCDPFRGDWMCTTDCGGGVCVPEPTGCPGENPQGCIGTGCPEGQECRRLPDECLPSACGCDESIGAWVCTADCSGGSCVPMATGCDLPNPEGCRNSGCPEGQRCAFDTGECAASRCWCDPETGMWGCTRDCGGGTCVADL